MMSPSSGMHFGPLTEPAIVFFGFSTIFFSFCFLRLARRLDLALAFFFQFRDKRKHQLLVALEFLQGPLLHRLVMFQAQEHLFLVPHLRHEALLLPRLLLAQAREVSKVFLLLPLHIVAFGHHRRKGFHLDAVLVQHVVHPVRLALRAALARQELEQHLGIAVAAAHIQFPDADLHRLAAHVDLLVQRIDIVRKLFHRTLHHRLVFRELVDIDAGLVQVLVQKRNRIEDALLLGLEHHEFLALLGEVGLQFLQRVLLFLDLGLGLLGRRRGKADKETQQGDKQTHG